MIDISLDGIGKLATSIRESITGEKIKDPEKVLAMVNELETTAIKAKGKVIEAEAKSERFLVAAWRPITMLVFVFIIANNYILVPYVNMFLTEDIKPLELTTDMWELLKLGIGGYILGRSAEKAVKSYKGK
jgi:hypothetical protein